MRLELPERKKLVHQMEIPIRWGDMDAMGHVNNTVYFRYLETLRIEWFRSIGCVPSEAATGPIEPLPTDSPLRPPPRLPPHSRSHQHSLCPHRRRCQRRSHSRQRRRPPSRRIPLPRLLR